MSFKEAVFIIGSIVLCLLVIGYIGFFGHTHLNMLNYSLSSSPYTWDEFHEKCDYGLLLNLKEFDEFYVANGGRLILDKREYYVVEERQGWFCVSKVEGTDGQK